MRISTSTIFESGGSRISDLQVQLSRTQQQIAAGRRILDPADDPIGSARALVITQSASVNEQYATNRKSATNALSIAESTLGNVTNALHNIKTSIVSAGNGALNDQDRNSIANELQGNLEELFGYANATDGVETYLFSGFNSSTVPFVKTVGGATYNGDQGKRSLQVGASREIPISDIGSAIFGDIRTSNSQFNILPNSSNTGKAVATATISNSANLTGNNYEVLFDSAGTNFTVQNKTTGVVSLPSPTVYVSGGTYTVDGIDIQLTDTPTGPGPNDKFTIQPGNQNIFETLTDLINALKTPASSVSAKLDLHASLSQANNNLDKSLSNVLVSRANLGTSLKELDNLDSAGESLGLLFSQELSALQDLDYAKAITELNQNQTILQAAQQSFIKTASLSLFNYIN